MTSEDKIGKIQRRYAEHKQVVLRWENAFMKTEGRQPLKVSVICNWRVCAEEKYLCQIDAINVSLLFDFRNFAVGLGTGPEKCTNILRGISEV